jgi:lipid-binding SYLF domain-containing protein
VQAAAQVLNEIQGAPDKGIPQEVLGSAECVAVVPSMLKGGFIVARSMAADWRVAALRKDGVRQHFLC